MKKTTTTLKASRHAVRHISISSTQRDYKRLIACAEQAIKQNDRRLLQRHLTALATVTHGLKLTLPKKVAYLLLKAIFEDADCYRISLKKGFHLSHEDQDCATSGPLRGKCVPRTDFTCYEDGLGSCISGPS